MRNRFGSWNGRHRALRAVKIGAALLTVGVLIGLVLGGALLPGSGGPSTAERVGDRLGSNAPRSGPGPSNGSVGDESDEAVVRAVRDVGEAVVKISVTQRQFIDGLFGRVPVDEEGLGSGVIVDPDGLVLTNHHVVAGASEIVVSLPDGRQFDGRVVGSFPESDLAVIRIDGNRLPSAALGSSSDLQVGQMVIAIGNPFGFEYSVTTGIVSALQRELVVGHEQEVVLTNLIQTDAAINPGNSGGPLVDRAGRVVGINTAVLRSVAGFEAQGLGFAIPIDDARRVAEEVVEGRRPVRLGILGGTLTPAIARSIETATGVPLGAERGVFVREVRTGTPAQRAGLMATDVIVSVDGRSVGTVEELAQAVRAVGEGGRLLLGIQRRGEPLEVSVAL